MNLKRYNPPTRSDLASWQDSMREAFFEAISPEDMRQIVGKLVEQAKAGDKSAIKILLSYGIGSPSVTVKNAVILQSEVGGRVPLPNGRVPLPNEPRPRLPAKPVLSLPGTSERVEDMTKRVANGQALFSAKDKKAAEG